MSDNRRIAKNSIILYLRLIVITIVGLFSSRIVLRCLGASDFGLYNVVGGIVVMLNILNTAMISTSFRYIAFELGKGNTVAVNQVFNISVVIHLCLAVVAVLLSETAGVYYIRHFLNVPADRIADAVFVFRWSVVAAIFSIISVPHQGLITALEQFTVRSIIEIIQVVLRLVAAIALIYWGADKLRLYAVLTAAAVAATSLLYLFYCRQCYADVVRWKFQTNKRKYLEMVGFSGWILLGAAACIGRVQGAALIINWFFGTLVNAPFAIANQVNQMVLTFTQNLCQAAIPQITKSYSSGNSDRTVQLVFYMTKYSFFLMLLPSLPILLETEFLLKLWLKEVPHYTVVFCQLMIFNALVECLNAAIPAAIQATGKIKYFQIIWSVITLSALPIAWMLFKFGCPPYSISVVMLLSSFGNFVAAQILLHYQLHYDITLFFKTVFVRICVVLFLLTPLFFFKSDYECSLLRFSITLFIAITWFLIIVYYGGLDRGERKFITDKASRYISKFWPIHR